MPAPTLCQCPTQLTNITVDISTKDSRIQGTGRRSCGQLLPTTGPATYTASSFHWNPIRSSQLSRQVDATDTQQPNQSSPAQYQPYPGPAQPQGPSPGQYGAPTPPSQAPYGAPPNQQAYGNQGRPAQAQGRPPAQAAIPPEFFKQSLLETIQEKQIHSLFPNAAVLDHISQSAAPKVQQLSQEWCLPMEVAQDIVKLALFDIVLFIGTSIIPFSQGT